MQQNRVVNGRDSAKIIIKSTQHSASSGPSRSTTTTSSTSSMKASSKKTRYPYGLFYIEEREFAKDKAQHLALFL